MTLRGCVLGNSHLAALRFAAADCADLPSGVALDFIGSAQNGLADVALDGQKLRATSAATEADFQRFGNVSAVDLAAYDFFVLVGLGLNIYGLEPFYRSHRCYGMRHWHQETDTRMLVSRPVAQAILLARLQDCLSQRLARLIRSAVDRPVFLQAQPRPGKAMLAPGGKYPTFGKMLKRAEAASLSALFEDAAAQLSPYYLPQPGESIADALFTADAYSAGSVRLTADLAAPVQHPANDFLHANASYGALALRQLGHALQAHDLI